MPKQTFLDRCIRDKQGNIVLAQPPNKPLLVFVGFFIANSLAMFTGIKPLMLVLSLCSTASLAYWAWLELTKGVNYFRRALGAVILCNCVMMLGGAYWLLQHIL